MRMGDSTDRIKQGRCWDCGQQPNDKDEAQEVSMGFNCRTCFERDTKDLLRLADKCRVRALSRGAR